MSGPPTPSSVSASEDHSYTDELIFQLTADTESEEREDSEEHEDSEEREDSEECEDSDNWEDVEDEVPDLPPVAHRHQNPDDYVVYGTTPPRSGRLEKLANKSHKYRSSKKLSPRPIAVVIKNPLKLKKVLSPLHDDVQKDKKRKRTQLRNQERDSKSSLHQVSLSPNPQLMRASSVDVADYVPPIPSGDDDFLSGSLQASLLSSWRESTNSLKAESSRPRRVQSDYSMTSQPLDERQYCPPDRKKFYRGFVNTLKHSKISHMARSHNEAVNPVMHIARMRSENLAIQNPFGDVSERLWLELQAYLCDKDSALYEEYLFYEANHIESVLRQVINFKMPLFDPVQSLNSAFLGVEDEPDGPRSQSSTTKQVSFSEDVNRGSDELTRGHDEPASACCAGTQDSLSSNELDEAIKYEPREFLSQLQLAAICHVHGLLQELEEIEALFPNRRKMGDEYSNYRTLPFRRRVGALVLWEKVTCGLVSKLCSLSSWLGVRVECKDVCNLSERPEMEVVPPTQTDNEVELSGILVTSPKSLSNRRARFSFHSGSSDDDPVLSHQVSSTGRSTNSTTTLQRLFSNYQSVLEHQGPYREFVNRGLKKKGLNYFMKSLLDFIRPSLALAQYALCPPSDEPAEEEEESHPRPLLQHFMNPELLKEYQSPQFERATSTGPENWIEEFQLMNLPLFTTQYVQLVHVPLDVMHECLQLQLELRPPQKPSPHSVRQLVRECRDTLEQAIIIRKFYRERMNLLTCSSPSKLAQVETDIEAFESDLKSVLEVYFDYLASWVQVSSGHILEEEWRHVKTICSGIRGGEAEAGQRFCDMASHLLESTGDLLGTRMDECCIILHKAGEQPDQRRAAIADSCRSFKELFVEIRERASKALGFAKMLRKDLEIAADFKILTSTPQLLQALQASDHVQVTLPNVKLDKMLFVTEPTSNAPDAIQELLNISFTVGTPSKSSSYGHNGQAYLLLVNRDVTTSQCAWNGQTKDVQVSTETASAISEIQVESLKMIVCSSAGLSDSRNSFLNAVGSAVQLTSEQTSSHENVAERLVDLKMAACVLGHSLIDTALQVMEHLGIEDTPTGDDLSKHYQATMHSCFNLGFEYVREVFRLLGDDLAYSNLGGKALDYAILWMRFVLEKCDRGRGTRPRWASTGLEFITIAIAPRMLATISQTRFEALKKLVDRCVDHIVGEAPAPVRKDKPVRSAIHHKRSWRSPRLSTRAYSEASALRAIPDEGEVELKHGPPSSTGFDVEQGIIRVQPESGVNRGDDPLGTGLLLSIPMLSEPDGPSPPVSIGSIDSVEHSSGVDSPLHLSSDLANPYRTMTTPTSSSRPPPPDLDRLDSSASVSRHYASTHSLTRWDSTPSFRGGMAGSVASDRLDRIRAEVKKLDTDRQEVLLREKVIGQMKVRHAHPDTKLGDLMVVSFKWQRGRKLGEGRFGKVYECLNLTSGEMHAVKQISLQEKDSSTVQTILDEITIFQGLKHENIVKFYGIERHHSDLFMFMELCTEGTVWSIARQGLTEQIIRHYTRDIVRAVYFLHDRGIVHRDIKGCNIFLSSNASIKLGDFGLSVQLKNFHKTMPNEIKKQVGTVPYMSPEVILNQSMGRPMDIWSIGCVVVEMATGKLPWSEYENEFQIMFQLGSGKTPCVHPPDALSDEGQDFIKRCFISNPEERWKAVHLLDHTFVKVDDPEGESEQ